MNNGSAIRIMRALDGGVTSSEIADELGIPMRNASAILCRLLSQGRVVRAAKKKVRAYVYHSAKRDWRPQDENKLREMAARPVADIASALNRTEWSIRSRANAIGLRLRGGRIYRQWTTGELKRLAEMSSDPVSVISQQLGRSKWCVRRKLAEIQAGAVA